MSLALLRDYRSKGVRAPEEVLEKGRLVLSTHSPSSLGEELWPLLEQVLLAAYDMHDLDLADELLAQLDARFPSSPRVECLQGMRLEAAGELDAAREVYEGMLEVNEGNAMAWKRLIAVYKALGDTPRAISELVTYLDTFYSDAESWLELAALYASISQYLPSLHSLSHALLLAPQNAFHTLLFAETAYTASDLPLALSYFLRATELVEPESEEKGKGGVLVRAWFGVKQCVRRIQATRQPLSVSHTPLPAHLELLDELATERLLAAYSNGLAKGRPVVVKWLESS